MLAGDIPSYVIVITGSSTGILSMSPTKNAIDLDEQNAILNLVGNLAAINAFVTRLLVR